ncbi:MAG: transcription-repair coupling factor [Myxococcales bacterium]|nr:transcription-repair coupling factor [Myxococcales bacterium]
MTQGHFGNLLPHDGRTIVRPRDVAAAVLADSRLVHASGSAGSAPAFVARELIRGGNKVLWVAPDSDAALRAVADLTFVLERSQLPGKVVLYPAAETSPYADVNPDRRAAQLRLSALAHLACGWPLAGLVVAAPALVRRVVPPDAIDSFGEVVRVDQDLDRDAFARRLVEAGYVRAALVEDPATFAVRGALVDVWPPSSERPVRIELLGDAVLGLKTFDPESQRTLTTVSEVYVGLAREAPLTPQTVSRAREMVRALCDARDMPSGKARALVEDVSSGRSFFGADAFLPAFLELEPLSTYLPEDMIVLLEDPPLVTRSVRDELERASHDAALHESGPRFPLESFYVTEEDAALALGKRRTVCLHRTAALGGVAEATGLEAFECVPTEAPTLSAHDQADLERAMRSNRHDKGKAQALDPLVSRVAAWMEEGLGVQIVARTATQVERITTLLGHRGIPVRVELGERTPDAQPHASADPEPGEVVAAAGSLSRGVVLPAERVVLVTEEEIFGARTTRGSRARGKTASSASKAKAFVDDLRSLSVGDFVVHEDHGVGRYLGLVHREVDHTRIDLCAIEYAGGDKLYLPVYRLNQLQKFAGGEGAPKLDRLGGQTFAKTKARAQREVRKMADELLRLYAERRRATREPLGPADDEYRAFEATFPFEETPDQARAIADVEGDLEKPSPMDRLVCGDVGFGKTEVAIRAAFRVASSGRQVAVLCPTTVLAQQHYLSFVARMQSYPVTVAALSRFQSKAEQDDVTRRAKAGLCDVVVGTHRLLSKDVHFKKLGLLVVDEEQRFGVTHKERIKQLRANVDVLTLSATPIPRTLQMAITGLRDMSVITTPPVDRRAIRTLVTRPDPSILREAVTRELDRGGQVFYVYNRVEGLYERAARLAELCPGARIAVAHGQMGEAALERTMIDFVEGRFDVLCATAIIESGLDIPRANTIIIDRADMFGLSQLYQLRGRVGRSRERAYCYLVVPPQSELSDEARARIEALERHTELGAGFQIASLDLELRGAGDLLGAEQSGTVASVGFELFCRMLDEAVHELSGEPVRHEIDPELSVDEEALLPEDYVEDVGVRLSLYKRLASASGEGEIDEIAIEMEDRFGPPPEAARRLVRLMRLKTELRAIRALGCEATKKSATLHLSEDTPIDPEKVLALVHKKRSPWKLSPDMRITRRIEEGDPVKGGLDAADLVLSELARCLKQAV